MEKHELQPIKTTAH